MIYGEISEPRLFSFHFDYLISEPAAIDTYSSPVLFSHGKNTGKLLQLIIPYKTTADIYDALDVAHVMIRTKKEAATKPVMIRYFDLLIDLLEKMKKICARAN